MRLAPCSTRTRPRADVVFSVLTFTSTPSIEHAGCVVRLANGTEPRLCARSVDRAAGASRILQHSGSCRCGRLAESLIEWPTPGGRDVLAQPLADELRRS